MRYIVKVLFFLTFFFSLFVSAFSSKAQNDQCFIYGTISTIDDDTYKGVIRWDKEEAFWTDFFNSDKEDNPYVKYLSHEDKRDLEKSTWSGRWRDRWIEISTSHRSSNEGVKHKFACQFGDIRSIQITGRESVNLEIKDGKYINLEGGSNDMGTKVWIMDEEIGLVKLSWDRIRKVDFLPTPKKVESRFGEPLYGIVETRQGKFKGFVQWDHDERLTTDKLDGETRDGDVSLSFGNLSSIAKEGFGCKVRFKSGRELYLDDSNDVDSGNRGIIVTIPEIGRVDIRWRDFIRVDFLEESNLPCVSYKDFSKAERISGKVTTIEDKEYSGVIVYDLDEAMDVEILEGYNDNLEYSIPFRNIKGITPKNYNYSMVELKNGDKLLLGEQRDVSEGNDGVLVFSGEDEPTYIPWKKIQKIIFD